MTSRSQDRARSIAGCFAGHAGQSGEYILRTPPCFWANVGLGANSAAMNPPAATNARMLYFISNLPDLVRSRARFFWVLVQGADAWYLNKIGRRGQDRRKRASFLRS